jgi:hypothetical protein
MTVTDSPSERRRRLWPWLIGVPLLLLLVGVTLTTVYVSSGSSRRLADAMSVADRDDPYWRLDDLMAHREQIPDAENSALVLAKAFERLPANWPSGTATGPGVSTTASAGISGAYERLDATDGNLRLDDDDVSVLRGELKVLEQPLAIARTVAEFRRGRHELVLGPTLIDTLLPQIQASRSVARLLEADAALRAHDGDSDGALDSCRAILATARSIGDEPMLISQLVRNMIDGMATISVQRVLGQGEPSDAALSRLQALILDEQAQPLLLTGMKGERAFLTEVIGRTEAGEIPLSAITGNAKRPSTGARAGDRLFATLTRTVLGGQQAIALEWMNEAVAISRRPASEHRSLWVDWDAKIIGVQQTRFGKFTAILPILLVPGTNAASGAFSRVQGALGATAILIAAERQRRRTGHWPASIKAIDPSIMPSPPVDPFTGESFRLEHRDGQLFIYSIGPNGKDEHGAYDLKRWPKGVSDDVGARAWDVNLRRQVAEPEDN